MSDHSSDVIGALEKKLHQLDVKIHLKSQVQEIWTDEDGEGEKKVRGVLLENGEKIEADRVIVATGGCSYQATGSTGDGYHFARANGHTVTEIRPALVPIETEEAYIASMQGLSLKNVELTIKDGKKSCTKILENFCLRILECPVPWCLPPAHILENGCRRALCWEHWI